MNCSLPGFSVHWFLLARILECVAIPFFTGSFWPRNWTQISCIAGRFFTVWVTREVPCVSLWVIHDDRVFSGCMPSNGIAGSYYNLFLVSYGVSILFSIVIAPIYIPQSVNSVTQSCPTVCDPMNCSMPGFPVHHQLPEFTETHGHRLSDAIQPSHPLSSPSPPAPNPSQHQNLFQWVSSSHEVAKVLEFQL